MKKPEDFTRINNDGNGNPRQVMSWCGLGLSSYEEALVLMKSIGLSMKARLIAVGYSFYSSGSNTFHWTYGSFTSPEFESEDGAYKDAWEDYYTTTKLV